MLLLAAGLRCTCALPFAHHSRRGLAPSSLSAFLQPAVLNCRQILKDGIGERARVVENRNPPFKIAVLKEKDIVSESFAASGGWEDPTDFLRRSAAHVDRVSRCAGKREFIDVGANIGAFTLTAATLNYSVTAFEPFSDNVRLLKYSICVNGLQDRVKLFTVALGEREHTCRLYSQNLNRGNGVVYCKEQLQREVDHLRQEVVRVHPMDDFSSQLHACSSMKIDVEGHEAKTLLGGAHFLNSEKAPLRVRTEVQPASLAANGISKEGYYWIYHALGYRPVTPDNAGILPVERYAEDEGIIYDREFVLERIH